MDEKRFDELTAAAAEGGTRRSILRFVLGGGLAAALGLATRDDAAAQLEEERKNRKKRKPRNRNKRKRNGNGGGNRRECNGDNQCRANERCRRGRCVRDRDDDKAGKGESCRNVQCENGLICVNAGDVGTVCGVRRDSGCGGCDNPLICVDAGSVGAVCALPARESGSIGSDCTNNADCDGALICANVEGLGAACVSRTAETDCLGGCAGGLVCANVRGLAAICVLPR